MNNQSAPDLRIGDVVFIRLPVLLFRKVANATASWTNHVGIVIGQENGEWMVAESCVPFARKRRFRDFVARSEHQHYVVRRLHTPLSPPQGLRLQAAVSARLGTLYHTGFALHSRRQFCSKFVFEVLREACGQQIGEIETFATLLGRNPQTSLAFWRLWFFGRIPWLRETITPGSQLACPRLQTVFERN
ncbi:MAG: YebB family permuted papain-like enzyme [Rhodocyclaceae bacterium]